MRVLIVEDERRLAETLKEILERSGYTCDLSFDGEDGLDNALSGIYDALLLDVMLPLRDGCEIVREMRRQGVATPVVMLTARREVENRVEGLDSGADYYLTKPFETPELLACLRAVSRRKGEVIMDELCFGDLTLSETSFMLSTPARRIDLRRKEFDIMRILLLGGGSIVAKETILTKVWGCLSDAEDNNVEVYISFLRKKLLYLNSRVSIATVRGAGYRLEEAEHDS